MTFTTYRANPATVSHRFNGPRKQLLLTQEIHIISKCTFELWGLCLFLLALNSQEVQVYSSYDLINDFNVSFKLSMS